MRVATVGIRLHPLSSNLALVAFNATGYFQEIPSFENLQTTTTLQGWVGFGRLLDQIDRVDELKFENFERTKRMKSFPKILQTKVRKAFSIFFGIL